MIQFHKNLIVTVLVVFFLASVAGLHAGNLPPLAAQARGQCAGIAVRGSGLHAHQRLEELETGFLAGFAESISAAGAEGDF